ncbi:MAG: glutathione peroxidase [Caulobacterales bacterium]
MATAFDFTFPRLADASEITLRDFAGKAILVVNVASACGYTPQYRELESLYEARAKDGLIVLGVPCNDFGRQESKGEAEIKSFCTSAYKVTFPMTGKVSIVGADRHPFYRWVALEAGEGALPRWNFHKFLIGKDGALVEGFASSAAPLGREMMAAIDAALAA